MENGFKFNSLEFITAGGIVSLTVAIILLVMSIASWYLIISKSINIWRVKEEFKQYTQAFWSSPILAMAMKHGSKNALANLTEKAVEAAEHYRTYVTNNAEKVSQEVFIARAMNRSIAEENSKMERGLTVLASVGSVSPFIGLFGTVWGIYHALASISQSGQATLDKVAGPVGEALIMTALGLAVAIPAVLAYNALVRGNRDVSEMIEGFGYDLHILLTTGAVIVSKPENVKPITSAKQRVYTAGEPA
jgi:biopolymer transport protein ExbB